MLATGSANGFSLIPSFLRVSASLRFKFFWGLRNCKEECLNTGVWCCLALLLITGGCAPTMVKEPLTPIVAKIDDPLSAELEFWNGLTTRPVVCNDDAFHGLLLFLDGKDPNADYAGRLAALKSRKLIPGGFNQPANQAVQRGTVAYAILQSQHIHGGWVLTVFGPSPRYAVRELMDMNLFPRSSAEQTFSGSEFVGVIGRAEDYHDGESAFIPATTAHPPVPGD